MLVSPAEPERLRTVGKVSSLPEQWGCDFLFPANGQWIGIQRKTIPDLIASVQDGRLAKEVAQIKRVDVAILIIEGQVKWTVEGNMVIGSNFGQSWTRKQFKGVLWSVRLKGIWVEFSDGIQETIQTLAWLESWFLKSQHRSLDRRPGPSSVWGKLADRDYARHLVMGLPGVGPELADRIVDRFGVPFAWKLTEKELTEIEGIGKVKARSIYAALEE